jgi:DNA-binding MarR family transcriptional regulator
MSRLQEEIRQKRPFRSLGQETTLALLKTADHVHRRLATLLAPYALTLQQYNVLRILRGAGEAGLPTLEIAARMIEQTPGITRLLDRLEKKKLVRRERCASDRRQVFAYSTPPGLLLLETLEEPLNKSDGIAVAALTPSQQEQLLQLLELLRQP